MVVVVAQVAVVGMVTTVGEVAVAVEVVAEVVGEVVGEVVAEVGEHMAVVGDMGATTLPRAVVAVVAAKRENIQPPLFQPLRVLPKKLPKRARRRKRKRRRMLPNPQKRNKRPRHRENVVEMSYDLCGWFSSSMLSSRTCA